MQHFMSHIRETGFSTAAGWEYFSGMLILMLSLRVYLRKIKGGCYNIFTHCLSEQDKIQQDKLYCPDREIYLDFCSPCSGCGWKQHRMKNTVTIKHYKTAKHSQGRDTSDEHFGYLSLSPVIDGSEAPQSELFVFSDVFSETLHLSSPLCPLWEFKTQSEREGERQMGFPRRISCSK